MATTKPTANQPDDYDSYHDDSQPSDDIRPGTSLVTQATMFPMATGHAPGSTNGLSELDINAEELKILRAPLDPETEIELRPDGIPYVPGGVIHERLISAFGPGQVALRFERDPFYDPTTNECAVDGSLWIRGQYVARAVGGCPWRPANSQMTKSDAIEGAKTDCIKRCAKELGMGSELRSPNFIREFIEEWGIPYQGEGWNPDIKKRGPKVMWRKKGVALSGQSLSAATSIAGEFPLGFGPDTPIPDGAHAGKPLRDAPDALVATLAEKASTREWRLTAKAEIVRRATEAREKAAAEAAKENSPQSQAGEVTLADVLGTDQAK